MPKAKELRNVLSRMKIVDDAVCIEANNQGVLNISCDFAPLSSVAAAM